MTISVAIVTHNEEKHIAECLKSLNLADEVIVVDGQSSDNTVKIAKKLGAKVFVVENQQLMKINMNLAFGKCSSEWILSIDADETVTKELEEEIKNIIVKEAKYTAYFIPRRNIVFGKWIAHTRWYPDHQLRLFRRGQAKFPAKNVHEELVVEGEIGYLHCDIEHQNYESVEQFIKKLNSYTTYEAEKLIAEKKKITWSDAIKFPVEEFLSRFFYGKGYLDGLHGLILSLLQGFYWEVIFAKVWESQGFWEYGGPDFLEEVVAQVKQLSGEFSYWVAHETKSPIRRVVRKIVNKISNIK